MSKSGLQRRLLESHLIIAFAGMLIILVLCAAAAMMGRSGAKLFESVGPIPNSSLSLINSLQASIAANHGWVYLGDRKFLDKNRLSWQNIGSTLQSFQIAVDANTEIVSELELAEILESISRLRELQAGIAHLPSSSDLSSNEIYTTHIEPLKVEINELMARLASDQTMARKSVYSIEKYFTETVLQLELSIKSREYIDKQQYSLARDKLVLSTIPVSHHIVVDGLDEGHVLQKLKTAINTFVEKADKTSLNHQVESNNSVREFLFEHAVPLSNSIIVILQKVVSRAQGQAELRRSAIKQVASFSLIAAVTALLGLIVSAIVLSINNANKLVTRLTSLSDAVEVFTKSASYKPIAVTGNDEISHLAGLFNVMALAINEKQTILRSYQNELELRVARRTRELFGAKEFAETTLRSVGDALITVNSDLVISMFNPAAERLLSVSADRAVGQPLASVVVLLRSDQLEFNLTTTIEQSMQAKQLITPDDTLRLRVGGKVSVAVKMSLAPIADMKANKAGSILILRNVERETKLQTELIYQANHDPLTGLRNRASFNAKMEQLLQSTPVDPCVHVIAFLDLDKFKIVNDSCGHAAGDELLKQISRLLSSNLRTGDMLARIGGDEFAIMLRDCDIRNGEARALKLRDRVANHRFAWDGRVFSVGVSIGITECKPGSGVLKEILTDADLACYTAKAAGRNQVRVGNFCHPTVDSADSSILSQENLLHALKEEIPAIKLTQLNGTITSDSETLFDPRLEFLDDESRPIAEHKVYSAIARSGLLSAYDSCLLSKSLSMIASNQQSLVPDSFELMINLSEALFIDGSLFERLIQNLEQKSIARDKLYFCFTEHSIFNNLESARTKLNALNQYGVRTIMANFSGSFSAITSIRSLTIDYLQIDSAIVKDICLNPVTRIVVRTICELANVSDMQTIVVGDFETQLYDELNEIGVTVILSDNNTQQALSEVKVSAHKTPFVKAS